MNHTRLEVTASACGVYGLRFLGTWRGATATARAKAEASAREATAAYRSSHSSDAVKLSFVARPLHAEVISWEEMIP